jgi:hypothetical protein
VLQLNGLQLHEIFNVILHLCYEVYVIWRGFIKWGRGILRQWKPNGRRA